MEYVIKKQFGRVVSLLLVMLMIFGSVPVDLYGGTVEPTGETQVFDYELQHDEDGHEHDYEPNYEDDEEDEAVIEWYSFGGYVVAEDETPLYGAEISLFYMDHLHARTSTDAQGRFFIDAMAFNVEMLDDWAIEATLEGFETGTAWLSEYIDAPVGTQYTSIEIDFQLCAQEIGWDGSFVLKGTVVSEEDESPLYGALVEFASGGYAFYTETDAYGFYEIIITQQDVNEDTDIAALMFGALLGASFDGFAEEVVLIDDHILFIDDYGRLAIDFTLRPEGFLPEGMALVHGIVTMDGEIVVGAAVNFYVSETDDEDMLIFTAETDEEGRYTIEIPAVYGTTYSAWATYIIEDYEVVVDEYGRPVLDELGNAMIERIAVGVAVSEVIELVLNEGDEVEANFELHENSLMRFDAAVTHEIGTWAQLQTFLRGGIGSNIDNFVITANITMGTGGANPEETGRGFVDGIPFMGSFTSNIEGTTRTINNMRLRPRSNAETITWAAEGRPDLNDFGFFRVVGSGAVIRDITFHQIRYIDETTLTQAPAWNTAVGNIGLIIGRVMPGALPVTMENVHITSVAGANIVQGTASGITTLGRTVLNKRHGGMIGYIQAGATVIINNSNVSMYMRSDPSSGGAAPGWTITAATGGVVGVNSGRVLINAETPYTGTRNTIRMEVRGGGRRTHMGGVIGRNFGISSESTIRNITVQGNFRSRQAGTGATQYSASGGFIATSASTVPGGVLIENVNHIHGTATGATAHLGVTIDAADTNNQNAAGGIIGIAAHATIRNATFNSRMQSHRDLGTIIGRATGTVVIDNVRNGAGEFLTETGNATRGVGGFVGHIAPTGNVSINDAINTRTISALRGHVGGIVGRNLGRLTITNSSNGIAVTGAPAISQTTTTSNTEGVGGLVGFSNFATITNSTNFGVVTSSRSHAGGIIGITAATASARTTLDNVHNRGTVTRQQINARQVGGLIGFAQCAMTHIENSGNHAAVTAARSAPANGVANRGTGVNNHIGGLVGRSNRALFIENSTNVGALNNTTSRPTRMGGLVGGSFGQTTILGSSNHGNITSPHQTSTNITTAASRTRRHNAGNNLGGIIGRFEPTATAAIGRVLTITDTINHGDVGLDVVATQIHPVNNAGGILGRAHNVRGAVPSVRMTNVENHGIVRAIRYVGGIIGIADQPNVTITGAINTGAVRSASGAAGQTSASRRNNTGTGGVVGRVNRPNFSLIESANLGNVYHTTAERRAGTGAGFGGLIGDVRAASGTTTIRSSYNAGSVRAHNTWRTGGIVGRKDGRGTLILENVYNIGPVWANVTVGSGANQVRGGNGILGFHRNAAAAGVVRMYNVFNAGNVAGRPIYGESNVAGTIRPARQRFQNVYWDTTVHTGANQTLAGGMSGIPTDILTRHCPMTSTPTAPVALMPGLNNPNVWRSGTISIFDEEREVLQNTYPFFAWQTDGQIEENFISTIRQTLPAGSPVTESGQPAAIMDLNHAIATARTASFTGIQFTDARIFDPYIARGATVTGAGIIGPGTTMHPAATAAAFTRTFTRNGMASMGIINPNGVVAFDVYDRPDVLIVLVLDQNSRRWNDELERFEYNVVTWANVLHEGDVPDITFPGGAALEDAYDGHRVDVTALGFAPNGDYITYQHLVDNFMQIFLTRVDMTVHFVIRDDSAAYVNLGGVAQSPILDAAQNAQLQRRDINIVSTTATMPNAAMTDREATGNVANVHHFVMHDVQWGDMLLATARHYHYGYIQSLTYYDIVNTQHEPQLLVVNIPLEDLRIGSFRLRLIEIIPALEGSDDEDTERIIPFADGAELLLYENPPGFDALTEWDLLPYTPGPAGGTPAYTIRLPNPTVRTMLQARVPGFRDSDVYEVGELIQFGELPEGQEDQDPPMLDILDIFMIRAREFTVRVEEHFIIPGTDEVLLRLISTSSLHIDESIHNWVDPQPTEEGVFRIGGVIDGDSIYATAPGFDSYTFTFDFEEIGSGDTITIILERNVDDFLMGFVRRYGVADVEAAGIVGAQVTAINMLDPEAPIRTVTSGTVGFYEIAALPVGTYLVFATHPNYTPALSTPDPVTMVSGTGALANIYMSPGPENYPMFVNVIDYVTRQPIEDATVTFNSTSVPASGTPGRFDLMLVNRDTGTVTANAPGYGTGTAMVGHDVTYDFVWADNHVFVTIALREAINNLEIQVTNGSTNALLTAATLRVAPNIASVPGAAVTGNNTGVFTLTPGYIGDILTAWAPGFVAVQHTIVRTDTSPVIIPLTELEPIATLTVTVRGPLSSSPLLNGSTLTLPPSSTAVITGSNGQFTVTGAYINEILSAWAPGFATGTHTIRDIDAAAGTIDIILTQFEPIETITVSVVGPDGTTLLPGASLAPITDVTITPVSNGTFTVVGAIIGQTLVASHTGFVTEDHVITTADAVSRAITIQLNVFAPFELIVDVTNAATGNTITDTAATLVVQGRPEATVTRNADHTFTITNALITDVLVANSPGFNENTIAVTPAHAAAGEVTIPLSTDSFHLTITNTPATLTHNNQILTAGTDTLVVGSANAVQFGTPVSLTPGTVTQVHEFLGWYRGETAASLPPAVGTHVSTLDASRFIPADVNNGVHEFNMP
ncbi:MAG: carboxypeptidase-like regulatory domain-containing protein, partial [Defluviitaleaceae bacterium]|nr:carboxypeptidase-like regulatory domain-containing protein [Defluviitaleaceae bacterium]